MRRIEERKGRRGWRRREGRKLGRGGGRRERGKKEERGGRTRELQDGGKGRRRSERRNE